MKSKAMGVILSPYRRIGGTVVHMPPLFARVQTDGSYRFREARIAALLFNKAGDFKACDMCPIIATSSTETEWASVAAGLQFAMEHGEDVIAIENDNLGVAHFLGTAKHEYARYYQNEIDKLASQTLWTGIRWIPREYNYADRLFRANVTPPHHQ
jgi:hypothetical protein